MIASAQAVEHYEITRYGTLAALAKQLGRHDCAAVLETTLEEEKSHGQEVVHAGRRRGEPEGGLTTSDILPRRLRGRGTMRSMVEGAGIPQAFGLGACPASSVGFAATSPFRRGRIRFRGLSP